MIWNRQQPSDHFWIGFFAGAVLGGAIGVVLASEAGRRAYGQLEQALQQVRGRFNGQSDQEKEATPQTASEGEAGNPT